MRGMEGEIRKRYRETWSGEERERKGRSARIMWEGGRERKKRQWEGRSGERDL